MQRPWLIKLGQFAVSGEWPLRGYGYLAEQIASGPHDSILDLGSGRSPLLMHLEPKSYAGLDLHQPDLDFAARQFDRPDYEFRKADILAEPLEQYRGVDVVTAASVFHHLTDQQVGELIEKVDREVAPRRMVFLDGKMIGPFGGVLARIDYGDPTRSEEELFELFRPGYEVGERWSYDTRLRTVHVFGFELKPARDRAAVSP